MKRNRIKTIGKLFLLFGLPCSILLGIFGWGTYYGVTYRGEVAAFERDWLGLDVEVPPISESAEPEKPVELRPARSASPARSPTPPDQAPDAPQMPRSVPLAPADPPREAAGGNSEKRNGDRLTPVAPESSASPLSARLAFPVVVRVKILVDDALVTAKPAWFDYVQRTVGEASRVYKQHLGIAFDLIGVVRWTVAAEGMTPPALLQDLMVRPREGADVLLGFTGRPLDPSALGQAEIPAPGSPFNGAYAVVYADAEAGQGHLRTLLHEVSHLFGARDLVDETAPGYQAGSWMRRAQVGGNGKPWIDMANRERILERKDRPFRPALEATKGGNP